MNLFLLGFVLLVFKPPRWIGLGFHGRVRFFASLWFSYGKLLYLGCSLLIYEHFHFQPIKFFRIRHCEAMNTFVAVSFVGKIRARCR